MTSDGYWVRRRVLGPVQQRVGALIERLAARTTTEPAIALGGALRPLGHRLRPAFYTPHPRPPLFVRGGPIPDQVPSAKGSGASPDRTASAPSHKAATTEAGSTT